MGRSIFREKVRITADRVRGREPEFTDVRDSGGHDDDVVVWLDLPADFRAPDDDAAAYRSRHTFDLQQADGTCGSDESWLAYMVQD